MKNAVSRVFALRRLIWLGLLAAAGFASAQTVDVQAVSMSLYLSAGDPRGHRPASLTYKLLNAGPDNFSNQTYLVAIYLAASGIAPDGGTLLGVYTNTLTLAAGQTNNVIANLATLNKFAVPTNMAAGLYRSWLCVSPRGGAPADPATNNNWVAGNLDLIPSTGEGRVFTFSLYAGKAQTVGSADGSLSGARFNNACGVAIDGSGNLFVADTLNQTIRKISPAGVVATLAGWPGSSGSLDGFANAARFNWPIGIAASSNGTIYVADLYNSVIRKISPAGIVSTLAGQAGHAGGADGLGSEASFANPSGVAVDGGGDVFVADTWTHTIRKIAPDGLVTTMAGSAGSSGSADGAGASARFNAPQGIAVDVVGNIFVADTGNHTLRQITPDGVVTTLAGVPGVKGALDGIGSGALMNNPVGVTVDSNGYIYVAESVNNVVRGVTYAGVVTTLGGLPGNHGYADGIGTAARFDGPMSVAVDAAGNLFVADAWNSIIRKGALMETALIAVQASPTNGGATAGAGYYAVGFQAQIAATANLGWRFIDWSDGETDNPRTVTAISGGTSYTANFEFVSNVALNVLLQAGNGGMAGVWGLGPGYQPANWTPVAGVLGGGWVLRALDGHRMLLQQGTGGAIGIWDTVGNLPVLWWPVSGALTGWIARDFDGNRILLQAGDGGMVGIWTLDVNNQPAKWTALSGPIPGLIARAIDGNRIMLQLNTGAPAGYWTLNGGNNVTAWTPLNVTLPAGWIMRSMTHDYILLQAGDGGMAGVWDIDADGAPFAWHVLTGALPGWILRGIEQH